jgi:hypothetical protein
MATKIGSAVTVTIIPMTSARIQVGKFGGDGNLFTPETIGLPFWIVRVPKEIIWGHGGLWSDNSVAMLAALFRMHFPLTAQGMVAPPSPRLAPSAPDIEQLKQDKLR